MHIIWTWIHPMRALVLLHIFLAVLAFTIHFILLSSERYNWLQNRPAGAAKKADVIQPMKTATAPSIFKIG
jgi:light-harvesting complex 1 alpha chain